MLPDNNDSSGWLNENVRPVTARLSRIGERRCEFAAGSEGCIEADSESVCYEGKADRDRQAEAPNDSGTKRHGVSLRHFKPTLVRSAREIYFRMICRFEKLTEIRFERGAAHASAPAAPDSKS